MFLHARAPAYTKSIPCILMYLCAFALATTAIKILSSTPTILYFTN